MNKILLSIFIVFLLGLPESKAQILQKTAQKIRSSKNISYTDIVRVKFHFQDDFSADTLRSQVYISAKEPKAGGYYFLKCSSNTYAFDGNKLVNLNLTDSTYQLEKESENGQNTRTLLYWAKNIDKLVKLPSSRIKLLADTVIHQTAYTNIKVTVSDTIIKQKHQYNATNFIIDKKSNLPIRISTTMKGEANDGSYFQFEEIHSYSDYQLNKSNFPDLSLATIPAHFRVPPQRVPVVFLPNGTRAPFLKAFDFSGKALDLEKLKGKLVLINFSLIGCPHCVGAAQMLNRLHEKYKDKDLIILNIYPVDQKEAIVKFDTRENVKTQSYTSDRSVKQAYPFDGYPSFYLLDKKGLVAQSYNGFYKELEVALIEKIESLHQ
ncbi:MAG: TlpA family protein disulfide reductase [Bacteroidia bacterium]